jgi:hypothetical protein
VLFRSAQFVQNLALERQIELGDRTHAKVHPTTLCNRCLWRS